MRTAIATGLILISTGWASAQTSTPEDAAGPAKTVTMTGCVAAAAAQSFTLSNAAIVPDAAKSTADSGEPSPVPTSASATPTQPPGSGSAASGATVGAGTAGTAVPAPSGTSGSVAKEKESSGGTYRLSGTDLTPWAGKRVQMAGTIVAAGPASAAASENLPANRQAASASAPPEFRVQSVQSIPGSCPQP